MPKKPLCGGISSKDLNRLVKNSYRKKKDIKAVDGYTLDRSLSTKKSKVYSNAEGEAIVTHAGTHSASDWLNNLSIPIGRYKYTDRYKAQ